MEDYLKSIEYFSEVDKRPKNVHLRTKGGNRRVLSMYDRPLPLKVQLEALAASLMEYDMMKKIAQQ